MGVKDVSARWLKASKSCRAMSKVSPSAFVKYFNKTMAKPFKWTYRGRALAV